MIVLRFKEIVILTKIAMFVKTNFECWLDNSLSLKLHTPFRERERDFISCISLKYNSVNYSSCYLIQI